MRLLPLLLLALTTLCAPLFGGDCAALTFTTLSTLTSHPVPYSVWATDLKTTDTYSPNLSDAISSWNRHFLLAPLVCVYANVHNTATIEREVDSTGAIPYLWVGIVPPEMVAQTGGTDNCHAAIVLFHEDHVDLVHTLRYDGPIEGRFYVEHLTWKAFVGRTYAVYEVVANLPGMSIHWGKLPSSLFQP